MYEALCYIDTIEVINYLEKQPNYIEWGCLAGNPYIFTYNYKAIKQIKSDINEAIIEWIWNPKHMNKWRD